MKLLKVSAAVAGLCVALAGCNTTISQKVDPQIGVMVTTIGIKGCGNPSHRITYVKWLKGRHAHPEDSYASSGPDLCNTAVAGAFGVGANAILPRAHGINNIVESGSWSGAQQSTSVSVGH